MGAMSGITIISQPSSEQVAEGDEFVLNCDAISDSGKLHYEWMKWDGSCNKPVGKGNEFVVDCASECDSGTYFCKISSSRESVETERVEVEVVSGRITITKQPTSAVISGSQQASFSIDYESYYDCDVTWSITKPGLWNTSYSDDRKTFYVSAKETGATAYVHCVIKNEFSQVASKNVSLSYSSLPGRAPIIEKQPSNVTTNSNSRPFMYVLSSNTSTYAWYRDGARISNESSAFLRRPANDTGFSNYYCILGNSYGSTRSSTASFIVSTGFYVDGPESQSVIVGSSATLSVIVSGMTTNLNYQWYKNGYPLVGQITRTYTTSTYDSVKTDYYWCVVNGVTSSGARVNSILYSDSPVITMQPTDAQAVLGSSALFSVEASGNMPITYAWYSTSGNVSKYIGSSKALVYGPIVEADYDKSFHVKVSNSYGSVTSNSVKIVSSLNSPTITKQPSSVTVKNGEPASFSIEASGATSYQWYNRSGVIQGASTRSYKIDKTNLGDAGSYYCVATNSYGSTPSDKAELKVSRNWTPLIIFASVILVLVLAFIIFIAVFVPMLLRKKNAKKVDSDKESIEVIQQNHKEALQKKISVKKTQIPRDAVIDNPTIKN